MGFVEDIMISSLGEASLAEFHSSPPDDWLGMNSKSDKDISP